MSSYSGESMEKEGEEGKASGMRDGAGENKTTRSAAAPLPVAILLYNSLLHSSCMMCGISMMTIPKTTRCMKFLASCRCTTLQYPDNAASASSKQGSNSIIVTYKQTGKGIWVVVETLVVMSGEGLGNIFCGHD